MANDSTQKKIKPKPRVLIVDDEPTILELLHAFLGDKFSVEVAGGPVEALNILKEKKFDLIISDMKMPVMSGFQFIKEVRSNLLLKTPVVVLTGDVQGAIEANIQLKGENAQVFSKPLRKMDQFVLTLQTIVKESEIANPDTPPDQIHSA
jgi:CheY-like chemotaxis protein